MPPGNSEHKCYTHAIHSFQMNHGQVHPIAQSLSRTLVAIPFQTKANMRCEPITAINHNHLCQSARLPPLQKNIPQVPPLYLSITIHHINHVDKRNASWRDYLHYFSRNTPRMFFFFLISKNVKIQNILPSTIHLKDYHLKDSKRTITARLLL